MLFRCCAILFVSITILAVPAAFLTYFAILAFADQLPPKLASALFDLGRWGVYPTRSYFSSSLKSPAPNYLKWDDACNYGHIMLTIDGPSVKHPGPTILDAAGHLVWKLPEPQIASNLRVQTYQGSQYLTFWSGEKVHGLGRGEYHMLNSAYEVANTITAIGDDISGDLHDFKITPQGTALITVYNVTQLKQANTGWGGFERNWIMDSIFQEIDIATKQLLFEWRASSFFEPADSFYAQPFAGYHASMPYDFFHINSVDKDQNGNYLISSRHLHSVICIDPQGEVLWILGGKRDQFSYIQSDRSAHFAWQHDARWASEPNATHPGIMTLLDNGKAGPFAIDASKSRGLVLEVDPLNRTALTLHAYTSKQGILSASQGSVQLIPERDHVFVGWGAAAAYTEFLANETMLCEAHFGASRFFRRERVKSYRAIKEMGWHGRPTTTPGAVIYYDGGCVLASWNGATDVAYWTLSERYNHDNDTETQMDWTPVDSRRRIDFETALEIPRGASSGRQYRVTAFDSQNVALASSETLSYQKPNEVATTVVTALMPVFFLALWVVFLLMRFCWRHLKALPRGGAAVCARYLRVDTLRMCFRKVLDPRTKVWRAHLREEASASDSSSGEDVLWK